MTQMPPPEPKFGEAGRSAWRKVWSAADRDSQRDGGSERIAELNIRRRGFSLGSIAHLNLPTQRPAR